MPSAQVKIEGNNGSMITSRLLLDTCSTVNFMTETLASQLQLHKEKCCIPVGALNALNTHTKHLVTTKIRSMDGKYQQKISFLTVPIITGLIPTQHINREIINIPRNIQLADPEFYKPANIDMLLGTGPTLAVLSIGQINLSVKNEPELYLQKTQLGWVIGGGIPLSNQQIQKQRCHVTQIEFDLEKFWTMEEGDKHIHKSREEDTAEEHFKQHVTRDATGRYTVALPFNEKQNEIGNSHDQAIKRFHSLERKFRNNTAFKKQYCAVINEYLELGHMSKVTIADENRGFYLPHHAVIKAGSLTTKMRVVFDGSAKSTTGISLNNALLTGPTIQDDLFTLLLRFRCHQYVLTGDIEKMYRQFWVKPADRQYQKIIWRDENNHVSTYQLNTITFGLAAAPFLAIRCLHQIADDEKNRHPIAAKIIKRDFYVDDLLTGFDTIEAAKEAMSQMTKILQSAGLSIRQWASNDATLLQDIPSSHINQRLQLGDNETIKTLGISWKSQSDSIIYSINPIAIKQRVTKRTILSEVARIFDPLGLLGPVILTAKRLIQLLWTSKSDWDESVPSDIYTAWTTYCSQLSLLQDLSFQRHVITNNAHTIELHGFCDASIIGYGACLYIRSVNVDGRIAINLLCSKSRVAPLKTISIPRLELCSALLLSQLYKSVTAAFKFHLDKTILWSDSMVTLHWINSSPHLMKTFVANRIAEIQKNTDQCEWRHIRSEDSPADALSRGQQPEAFIHNHQWRYGPSWLREPDTTWTYQKIHPLAEDVERKRIVCLQSMTMDTSLLTKYSSITKLQRIVAYCLRFKGNHKNKGILHLNELNEANQVIIRRVQQLSFQEELHALTQSKDKYVHNTSELKSLNPFIDKNNVLRVGGRLQRADIAFSQQHPIILPKNNHVTDLLIEHGHVSLHHAGGQATLYSLRQRYWIIDGRNQVRKIIRRCMRCAKAKPPPIQYVMGNLPAHRVNAARPFSNVGVDYCGPFFIKEKKFRNRVRVKVYVAVFVCLVVKAVHLELVSDLTTAGFIGALRRFISRRGKPHTIHSDNGTNFVGANNELKTILVSLQTDTSNHQISSYLHEKGVQWKFLPPQSPHFGGIWEAAVRSFKHHLKRVVGNELFTFEHLNSLIIEIEAILNSRPLTPLSSDPNDLLVLTPGHFLIGDALTSLPEYNFSDTSLNRLSTWQHVQKMRHDFWTRWHKEYLNELNIRHKWTSGHHNIKEGTIVLLRDDNLPPMQWRMGRVIKTHPGEDNIIRVVSIQTSTGIVDRNIKKIAFLPIVETPSDGPTK